MRLRHDRRADEAVENSEYVEQNPVSFKGKWKDRFGNNNPIHVEIGMGKGNFITTLAAQNPDINYIGIERVATVIFKGLKKQQELKLKNLILVVFNAENITEVFDKDEVDRIYLNFSDPWPKDRHARRRLTAPGYLEKYNIFLKQDGDIAVKTDNRPLFDFTLESAKESGWQTLDVTYDLHNSEFNEGNIMTEYEQRFSSMGTPINRVVLKK